MANLIQAIIYAERRGGIDGNVVEIRETVENYLKITPFKSQTRVKFKLRDRIIILKDRNHTRSDNFLF